MILKIEKDVKSIAKNFKNLYNELKSEGKIMLPLITEEHSTLTYAEVFQDIAGWRKQMVQHLKEENPEVNSAILEVANNTDLDPKAVALGAFMVYRMLEMANEE